jgi:hypothetical protein
MHGIDTHPRDIPDFIDRVREEAFTFSKSRATDEAREIAIDREQHCSRDADESEDSQYNGSESSHENEGDR